MSDDLFNLHKYNCFINKLTSGEKIELGVRNIPQLTKIELAIVDTQHGSYSDFSMSGPGHRDDEWLSLGLGKCPSSSSYAFVITSDEF